MPHIHTNPGEHDTTASAWIVNFKGDEPRLLLHMHKKLHSWMQPGGHVELTETPWQAILHEILEETGYAPSQLGVLQPIQRLKRLTGAVLHPMPFAESTHPFPNIDHKHTDRAYAFATDQDPLSAPGEAESPDLRWVSLDELINMPSTEIYNDVRESGIYVLDICATQWERVPIGDFQA